MRRILLNTCGVICFTHLCRRLFSAQRFHPLSNPVSSRTAATGPPPGNERAPAPSPQKDRHRPDSSTQWESTSTAVARQEKTHGHPPSRGCGTRIQSPARTADETDASPGTFALDRLYGVYLRTYSNIYAERWVWSAKHECLNYFTVLGKHHLEYIIEEYVDYYNRIRPHQSVGNKPIGGLLPLTSQTPDGEIERVSILGGLFHQYQRKVA